MLDIDGLDPAPGAYPPRAPRRMIQKLARGFRYDGVDDGQQVNAVPRMYASVLHALSGAGPTPPPTRVFARGRAYITILWRIWANVLS